MLSHLFCFVSLKKTRLKQFINFGARERNKMFGLNPAVVLWTHARSGLHILIWAFSPSMAASMVTGHNLQETHLSI
jgi:hypothetical protein